MFCHMLILTYKAKIYQTRRRGSYWLAVEGLPVIGGGRNLEEARENTEYALREHLGTLLYEKEPLPIPHKGEDGDFVVIEIARNSLRPTSPPFTQRSTEK